MHCVTFLSDIVFEHPVPLPRLLSILNFPWCMAPTTRICKSDVKGTLVLTDHNRPHSKYSNVNHIIRQLHSHCTSCKVCDKVSLIFPCKVLRAEGVGASKKVSVKDRPI